MEIFTHIPLACSRVSDSREDKKLKGTRKVGGAGKRKKEGIAPPLPVSSRFIFMFALSQFSGPDYLGAWNRLMFHKIREIKTGNENDEIMEQNVFRRSRSPTLRVNVSKNQTKIENSWPQSKNRFGSFFVHGKANVLPSVKWSFLKHAFFWNKPLKIILPYLPTLFGLKLGQDFKNRGAPPNKNSQEYPPRELFEIDLWQTSCVQHVNGKFKIQCFGRQFTVFCLLFKGSKHGSSYRE